MMSDDFVDDNELLYRRIPAGWNLYKIGADGKIEISSQAFADRELRVSVDRAKLCGNNPQHTLGDKPGGVVTLLASEVRNIDDLVRNAPGGNVTRFKIEIEPVPLFNNPAHAEIYANPQFTEADKRRAFKRLCQRLAQLAESTPWAIPPI